MLRSMTAYSNKKLILDNCILEFTLSSLNSKYLKIYFDLPENIVKKENRLRKIIKNRIKRGKINLKAEIKYNNKDITGVIDINRELIEYYYNELNKLDIQMKIDLSDILELPNVVQKTDMSFSDESWNKIYTKVKDLIDDLINEENNEGLEIEKDILKKLEKIENNLNNIEVDKNLRIDKYRKLLLKKVDELGVSDIIDEDRMYKEISYFADKIDINEEIVRIKTHLKRLRKLIKNDTVEKGKKIKFFSQEMFREVNTIGAKIKDADISHWVVNIKELLGNIKEQSYNVW
ncbi:MAG: YicC family protein [Candidatus Mcinerneyibacterium aminivorans]|uniref:YicC family protein n=1 Tax=Candidatus Mcinerneyibacterium aminivorans TaxID=2703815 RepID=A0A5D0MJ23_9BACT|nr:MAG: YicC family protein [Candidatus Mcinerneyibacterium aminivorans]